MKQILVMMAAVVLVGCSKETPETSLAAEAEPQVAPEPTPEPESAPPSDEKLIADTIVEKAIRRSLKKPEGGLTETDLKEVTDLTLMNYRITDAGLKEVTKLQNLEELSLYNTEITNESLKEVAKLQKLTNLTLPTQITDAGLKEVAKLQELVQLYLYHTKITYEGLAELKKAMPNCEIRGNPTPPPMSEKLIVEKAIRNGLRMPEGDLIDADLERVTHLFFGAVNLTEEGLRELVRLDKLELLHFERSQITDKGLKEVAKLQNLESLHFNGTPITDVGLKEVAKMKQLKSVSMFTGGGAPWTHGAETRATFTRAGMAELRKALPNCRFNP